MQNLSSALKEVCDWHQLGIQLGIPTSELRKIEEDYAKSDRRMTETLDTWLQRTPSASWNDVLSALQQMGENTVAESVRQKYIRGIPSKSIHIYIVYMYFLFTACHQFPVLLAEDTMRCVVSDKRGGG